MTGGGVMVRTDDDTWDITEGVGTIALGMAAARAAETASARPLVEDPYAIMFLDAAGDGFWSGGRAHQRRVSAAPRRNLAWPAVIG
jgi:O-methyltransferase involved in polyketide biosynthesis